MLSDKEKWAQFRFGVVGSLLIGPKDEGGLQSEWKRLADKVWQHPITGEAVRYGASTIERWYYTAKKHPQDRFGALLRKTRNDHGEHPSVGQALRQVVLGQYRQHKSWSYQLHYDNLCVQVAEHPALGPMPSYESLYRYMLSCGLQKQPRRGGRVETAGTKAAEARFENAEVRSYEMAYPNALWHLDFHTGSLKVLLAAGLWVWPVLMCILDDCSRLILHAQWYVHETAENLIHALCQAFQKRGLCHALMSDNGSAMIATETEQGLLRLGVVHERTLPYSPYQNGKQEIIWGQVEGRLLPMLEPCKDLTMARLNEATLAWVELEYNRKLHSELGVTPLARYLAGKNVGRPCPDGETLRQAFTQSATRTQRRSDGTISLDGIRFEVNSAYRHLKHITARYASWDLARAWQTDPKDGQIIRRLYPLNKVRNADGLRSPKAPLSPEQTQNSALEASDGQIAPLLRKLIAEYAATGLPPAYLPKDEPPTSNEQEPQ
jgi:hypothetical protein